MKDTVQEARLDREVQAPDLTSNMVNGQLALLADQKAMLNQQAVLVEAARAQLPSATNAWRMNMATVLLAAVSALAATSSIWVARAQG